MHFRVAVALLAVGLVTACSTGSTPRATRAAHDDEEEPEGGVGGGAAPAKAGSGGGGAGGGDDGGAAGESSGASGAGDAGAGDAGSSGAGGGNVCEPGKVGFCNDCPDGLTHERACKFDGSGWLPCECPGGPPASGAGGTGGAAGTGGTGGKGGSGSGSFCLGTGSPAPASGTGMGCVNSVDAFDWCGVECGTPSVTWTCTTGEPPPAAAGACTLVQNFNGQLRLCCANLACVPAGGTCSNGQTGRTFCPKGLAPPGGGCSPEPGSAGIFCCGDTAPAKCQDAAEPNDSAQTATKLTTQQFPAAIQPGAVDWYTAASEHGAKVYGVRANLALSPSFYTSSVEVCAGALCGGGGTGVASCNGTTPKTIDGVQMCCTNTSTTYFDDALEAAVTCPTSTSRVLLARVSSSAPVCVDTKISLNDSPVF